MRRQQKEDDDDEETRATTTTSVAGRPIKFENCETVVIVNATIHTLVQQITPVPPRILQV